jgi:hypothetical protein
LRSCCSAARRRAVDERPALDPHSFALGPGAIIAVATGAVSFSLTAQIFW